MTYLFTLLVGAALFAVSPKPGSYTNARGIILVSVYSRGAYQFVLATPDANAKTRLYPVNLSEAMKEEAIKADPNAPLQVRFSGRLTGKKQTMKQITANDAGEAAGQVSQIRLTAITVLK